MALRPKSCRVCMSFSTKEVRGSNVSSSGSHGGPFTTTFTPWKYLSLPSSSTMRCVDVFTCKQSDPGPWALEKAPRPRISKSVATCKLDIFSTRKMWDGLVHVTHLGWFQLQNGTRNGERNAMYLTTLLTRTKFIWCRLRGR